ncbi:serine hydrolase domain-containing protein [Daejeonella lutea]|uniref:CubicO group peptidase, beta-lactamase class C family n=1 Tax=Daejeonella lutea TaxID=572036 RepID=A0A1T5CUN5_9SPHI|nr:serine hydrolase [Daejeonella lutea]SKB63169.1 CubicO group peptidase, beta-lactamase class C family [Daejeonella lutea]
MKTILFLFKVSLLILLFGSSCVQPFKSSETSPVNNDQALDGRGPEPEAARLKSSQPEEAGVNSTVLKQIDKIANEAIRKKAAPSITIMVIKDARVVFDKAYGTHTYSDRTPTQTSDIYDLASLTKISATTLAAMRLYELGKLDLDANVGLYLTEARNTNKNRIRVRDLLLHEAGLVPQIPFHLRMSPRDYSRDSSSAYPTKVSDNYFLRKGYFREVMWPGMLNSPISDQGKYAYSDLSMYILKEIVERQSGQKLENYVQEHFYQPLGMLHTGFNPLNRFTVGQIIPTENDVVFRKSLLRGYVHDEGAALAGGVSGHAGLFSNAGDLGVLFQMLINRGNYNGKNYFKPETVDLFTTKQSPLSRRGLGFDRWDPNSKSGFPSKLASPQTYGHTGFTGTCVWVDPKYNLIYIFLSNRVHPNRSDKLIQMNIRGRIQDVIYEAIAKNKQ